jgi:hypothetical protein
VTEAEWLAATDPEPMLAALQAAGEVSERKLRLFVCHCCYHAFGSYGCFEDEAGDALLMAEWFADGEATGDDLAREREAFLRHFDPATEALSIILDAVTPALATPMTAQEATRMIVATAEYRELAGPPDEPAHQCDVLRDIFGNPFRPPPFLDPSWLTWGGGAVRRLAAAAYEGRDLAEGPLDRKRLAEVVKALKEAGCIDWRLLGHLRERGAVHVRGCWAVDLLTGRT